MFYFVRITEIVEKSELKVMQVDFKKEGAGGKNARNSQDIRESELLCVTDFDFIYDCPMSKLIMYFGYLSLFGDFVFLCCRFIERY